MAVEDVQDFHDLLRDYPQLFVEFARFLLPSHIFSLSQDIDQTRSALVEQDEKILQRKILSARVDASRDSWTVQLDDTHLFHLLSSTLRDEERKNILLTLRGGDAQYALLALQWLLDAESCRSRFVDLVLKDETSGFGGEDWHQAQRILVKLAAFNDQVPPPLRLKGLRADEEFARCSQTAYIHYGRYKGMKVAVKMFCAFGTAIGRDETLKCREASV
ncbi:hypothetical protein EIP86_003560 [Pleurotus ostreatoroseus]|nr:hypothetical protein EIP86_003560 [Pleurotus ostreatoroseus]